MNGSEALPWRSDDSINYLIVHSRQILRHGGVVFNLTIKKSFSNVPRGRSPALTEKCRIGLRNDQNKTNRTS